MNTSLVVTNSKWPGLLWKISLALCALTGVPFWYCWLQQRAYVFGEAPVAQWILGLALWLLIVSLASFVVGVVALTFARSRVVRSRSEVVHVAIRRTGIMFGLIPATFLVLSIVAGLSGFFIIGKNPDTLHLTGKAVYDAFTFIALMGFMFTLPAALVLMGVDIIWSIVRRVRSGVERKATVKRELSRKESLARILFIAAVALASVPLLMILSTFVMPPTKSLIGLAPVALYLLIPAVICAITSWVLWERAKTSNA